jgi:three-Cys-motif partner protein
LAAVSDDEFFTAKKAAAVLKHGILSRYVLPFATKTGSTSRDGRVVVLDGYAGEGRYEDGSPGSPIFMTASARQLAPPRQMELFFVEEKKERHEKLTELLQTEAPDVDWTALRGSVENHLDKVLQSAEGVPFFAFLDPCGLGLTFDDLVNKIYARPHGNYSPGTEILVNFSAEAVRRIGGRLKEAQGAAGREATLARMDAVCGGVWWREIYLHASSPELAAEAIANGYFHRLTKATGAGGWVIEVKNAEHQQPKYSLVFLSRHNDGLMVMGEAVSKSQEDWREACIEPGTLFSDAASFKAAEAALVDGWVTEMKTNVKVLLEENNQFKIRTHYSAVMGSALGDARMTHLRKALKELHKEGVTSSTGVGNPLWDQMVVRA